MHSHMIAYHDFLIERAMKEKQWSAVEALMNRRLEYIRLEAAYEMGA